MERVELSCHSNFSCMAGVLPIESIVSFADEHSMPAVALTDIEAVQGYPEAWRVMKDYPDIKMIYGVEAHVIDDVSKNVDLQHLEDAESFDMSILIRNKQGKYDLFKLITDSELVHKTDCPHILLSELLMHRENLLLGSAGEQGIIYQSVKNCVSNDDFYDYLELFDYIEVQPGICLPHIDDPKVANEKIVVYAQEIKKVIVATGNVYYIDEEELKALKILCESNERNIGGRFLDTEEMLAEFDFLGKEKAAEIVITNTNLIADKVEALDIFMADCDLRPEYDDADAQLREVCENRLAEIYGSSVEQSILDVMNWELHGIRESGTASLLLLARELVSDVGLSPYEFRFNGSIGGSLVAYLCGLTCMNPIEAELELFPEFVLGIDGDKEIDIEIVVPDECKEKAWDVCGQLESVGSAIHCGCYVNISEREADDLIDWYEWETGECFSDEERVKNIAMLSEVIGSRGSMHSGGLFLIPEWYEPIEFTPVIRDRSGEHLVSEIDYHSLDCIFRLNILSAESQDMMHRLTQQAGRRLEDIPLDDPEVFRLFRSVYEYDENQDDGLDASGVPDFNNSESNIIAIELDPDCFADIVRVSGLSHSTGAWEQNAEEIILDGVASKEEVISTREDIYENLIRRGMPREDAWAITEFVRKGKATQKALRDEWMPLAEMMRQYDIPDWYISSCEKIRYLFPRAYCYRYALDAYWGAWFKLYSPQEFYDAYFACCVPEGLKNAVLHGKDGVDIYRSAIRDAREKEYEITGRMTIAEPFGIMVAEEMFKRGFALSGCTK